MSKFFGVKAMTNGEVRVEADLFGEEIANGVVVRGFTADEALTFATQLIEAALQSGENRAKLNS